MQLTWVKDKVINLVRNPMKHLAISGGADGNILCNYCATIWGQYGAILHFGSIRLEVL